MAHRASLLRVPVSFFILFIPFIPFILFIPRLIPAVLYVRLHLGNRELIRQTSQLSEIFAKFIFLPVSSVKTSFIPYTVVSREEQSKLSHGI